MVSLTSKNSRKPLFKPILIICAHLTEYGNSTYVKIIPGSFRLQYDEILNLESRPPGERYKIPAILRKSKFSPVIVRIQGNKAKTLAIFHQGLIREKWRNRWLALNWPFCWSIWVPQPLTSAKPRRRHAAPHSNSHTHAQPGGRGLVYKIFSI